MTKEIHYFLFSKEEVFSALLGYQYALAKPPPTGAIATLLMTERSGGIEAVVRGESRKPPEETFELSFSPTDLLASIILYCCNCRIPLAVRAVKRLELLGDQLALLTTMNLEQVRPESHSNAIRYTDDLVEARRKAIR